MMSFKNLIFQVQSKVVGKVHHTDDGIYNWFT
jgi:hypothetical protein